MPSIVLAVLLGVLAGAGWNGPAVASQTAPTDNTGRTVRLTFPQDDGSLTPYTFELGYPLMTLVYDTLMWRNADGLPEPLLARSVETDPTGTQVTVHLVDNARWQDHSPVTASDVVFTFDYVRAHPQVRFTPELDAVDLVRATDDQTAVISLRHPSPGFFDQPLTDLPIIPAHLWAGLPAGQIAPDGLPVGSGPYRLVSHDSTGYRFEANGDYFRGPPAVASIVVTINNDLGAIYTRFQAGVEDIIPFALPKDAPDFASQPGVSVAKGPSYSGAAVVFNVRQPPFDQAPLRRALAEALDDSSIASAVGQATPATKGLIHPDSPWAPTEPVTTFDETAAKTSLATLRPAPFDLYTADNDPVHIETAHQVALAWSQLGVQVTVRELSRSELSSAVGDDGSTPNFAAAVVTTPALASYDPDFLSREFASSTSGGSLNESGYASSALDDLASRIGRETDAPTRHALVDQALRLLSGDAPVVPVLFANGVYAYRPGAFDGWVFIKGAGILDKRSFVAPAKPLGGSAPVGGAPLVRHSGGASRWWIVVVVALAAAVAAVVVTIVRKRHRAAAG